MIGLGRMIGHWTLNFGLVIAGLLAAAPNAHAEAVRVEHVGLDLLGNFEHSANVRPASADGVALVIHEALSHHGAEPVRGIQTSLKAEAIASLAITLSLGLNQRRDAFDCRLEHDHRNSDAVDEIAAWVAWLKAQGVRRIALIGAVEGARQVLDFALAQSDAAVQALVLFNPQSAPWAEQVQRYRDQSGGDLAALAAAARKLVEDGEEDTIIEAPEFLGCHKARVSAAAFLDYYGEANSDPVVTRLPELKLPALIITGGPRDEAGSLAGRLRTARLPATVKTVTVNGSRVEAGGASIAQPIREFLGKLPGR